MTRIDQTIAYRWCSCRTVTDSDDIGVDRETVMLWNERTWWSNEVK